MPSGRSTRSATPEARRAIRGALADASARGPAPGRRGASGIRGDREALAGVWPPAERSRRRPSAARRPSRWASSAIPPPVPSLMAALGDSDPFAAWSIRQAIRRLGRLGRGGPGRRPARRPPARGRPEADRRGLGRRRGPGPDEALRRTDTPACGRGSSPTWPASTGSTRSGRAMVRHEPAGRPGPRRRPGTGTAEGMTGGRRGLPGALADRDPAVRRRRSPAWPGSGPDAARCSAIAPGDRRPTRATWRRWPRRWACSAMPVGPDPGDPVLGRRGRRPESVRAAALDALGNARRSRSLCARLSLVYDPKAPPTAGRRGALPGLGRGGVLPPNDLAGFPGARRPRRSGPRRCGLNARRPLPDESQAGGPRPPRRPGPRGPRRGDRGGRRASDAARRSRGSSPSGRLRTRSRPRRSRPWPRCPTPRPCRSTWPRSATATPRLRRTADPPCWRSATASAAGSRQRRGRASSTGPAALALERVLARFQPILDWRVIGPFPRTTPQVFVGEPFDRLRPDATSAPRGGPIAWAPRKADAGDRARRTSTTSRRGRATAAGSATTPTARPTSAPSATPRSTPTAMVPA